MVNKYSDLRDVFSSRGINLKLDEPMSEHTTFRIGGPAKIVLFPSDCEQFVDAVTTARDSGGKYIVIGNGSDLLFDDRGYDGVIICTKHIKGIEKIDSCRIEVMCGVSCNSIANFAADNSLSGFEFAYGIPGSCGGAVFMNAGAYGSEISAVLESVLCFDISKKERIRLTTAELDMSYRHSAFMSRPELVILSAVFKLAYGDEKDIRARMHENLNSRRSKQPIEPSAGSVFKRHEKYIVAKIIDECGLKGYTIGGAQVSEKHAGFIVNCAGASSSDVLGLISQIKSIINKKYGFEPECEIRYIQ